MHLFAGAGGGLLADLILGHTPIVAVEWDKHACKVLRDRAADGWFPGLHVHEGDVRMFDPSEYAGRVGILSAGFPCQDISVAGDQAGVGEGTRSGLYREVLRIADIVRPRYLFLENVAAILANEHLGTVLGDLAARGFDARWCCLEASGVGAPHKRDRWWCLCTHPNRERQLQPQGLEQDERGRIGDVCENVADTASENGSGLPSRTQTQYAIPMFCSKYVADANAPGFQELHPSAIPDGPRPSSWCLDAGRREGPAKPDMGVLADELASHMDWWSEEPDVGRVAEGIPNRVARLKMLGNGQVPLQAATAWMLLGGPL